MKKLAAAVAVLIMLAGLTAGSVSSSGSTAPDRSLHVKRMILTELTSHQVGGRSFAGTDRTEAVEEKTLVIPRLGPEISGANFEILIGFDVTPQMAEFNRTGSRFRVNAGVLAPSTDQ